MFKGSSWLGKASFYAAALFTITATASPSADDKVVGSGCIATATGRGVFQFVAEFDIDNPGSPYSGTLTYTDASAGLEISSNTLVDYVADWTWRAAVYVGPGFEARVFIYDFGAIGDLFEIQIFTNGGFYSAAGPVTADCDSDIIINPPDTTPEPEPEPEPEPGPTPEVTNPGTGTPGYWKNHPEAWPNPTITIGGETYTVEEAIARMGKSGGRDMSYTMFAAVAAATLNVAIGNDPACIAEALAEANTWLEENAVGSRVRANSSAWSNGGEELKDILDAYNNGELCAPHRD